MSINIEELKEDLLDTSLALPGKLAEINGRQVNMNVCIAAVKTIEHLERELTSLRAEVKEWMCNSCNMVYMGPPQTGLSCVICPSCGGYTAPKSTIELLRMEEELEEYKKKAERYDLIKNLAYGESHDLKTDFVGVMLLVDEDLKRKAKSTSELFELQLDLFNEKGWDL